MTGDVVIGVFLFFFFFFWLVVPRFYREKPSSISFGIGLAGLVLMILFALR